LKFAPGAKIFNPFIFEVTDDEFTNLKSHFATSSWGGRRKRPAAFIEHGAISERIALMAHILNRQGIYARVRDSAGQEIEGACGQLRARAVKVK